MMVRHSAQTLWFIVAYGLLSLYCSLSLSSRVSFSAPPYTSPPLPMFFAWVDDSFVRLSVCLPARPHVRPAICMFVCLLLTRGCLVLSLLASVLLLLLTVSSFAPARPPAWLASYLTGRPFSSLACVLVYSRVFILLPPQTTTPNRRPTDSGCTGRRRRRR